MSIFVILNYGRQHMAMRLEVLRFVLSCVYLLVKHTIERNRILSLKNLSYNNFFERSNFNRTPHKEVKPNFSNLYVETH